MSKAVLFQTIQFSVSKVHLFKHSLNVKTVLFQQFSFA